jgi:ABC-type polysaccharide/polyol phosphate export permease
MSVSRTGWVEIRPARGRLRGFTLREVWAFRDVVPALVRRDIKSSHKQSSLGVLWIVLGPLLGTVVFSVIFGELAGLQSDGLPYPIFALSGLVLWSYLTGAAQGAADSIVDETELVTKVYFPPILAPLAAVLTPLLDLAVTLVALAVALLIYGVGPGLAVLTLPGWIAAAVVFALGVGLGFCTLNVRFRDASSVFGLLLQLWLFISPLVFASSSVEGWARWLLGANPVCGLLDGFRWATAGAPPPPVQDLPGLAIGVLVVVVGFMAFVRSQRRFVDIV